MITVAKQTTHTARDVKLLPSTSKRFLGFVAAFTCERRPKLCRPSGDQNKQKNSLQKTSRSTSGERIRRRDSGHALITGSAGKNMDPDVTHSRDAHPTLNDSVTHNERSEEMRSGSSGRVAGQHAAALDRHVDPN